MFNLSSSPYATEKNARLKKQKYLAPYVQSALEQGGQPLFLQALGEAIKARGGHTAFARKTGIRRETLYRMLSLKGNPTLKNINTIFKALNLRLVIKEE